MTQISIPEEVRLRTADIVDLKKALREEQIAARKTSVALDATRAERNMLHKNYTEALDEIQDLKQKLRVGKARFTPARKIVRFALRALKADESVVNRAPQVNATSIIFFAGLNLTLYICIVSIPQLVELR